MRDRRDEFGDALLVAVTFTKPENLASYRNRFVEPMTVITDEQRASYKAFGMGRASTARVYSPAVIRRYIGLLREGRRMEKSGEDTRQLGGDFVIAPDGTIAWSRPQKGPEDRPAVDEILAAVRSIEN